MALELKPYDVAEYLDSDEMILAYLTEALDGDDPHDLAQAIGDVARARGGLARLASDTGIELTALQRELVQGVNPDLGVLLKVLRALGVRVSFSIAA